MHIGTSIPAALWASWATLLSGQVGPDPTSIVQNMAENIERTSSARRQYIYDKIALACTRTSGRDRSRIVERHGELRYVVTGALGQVLAVDGFKGECRSGGRVAAYTQLGFPCKRLDKIDGVSDTLLTNLLDETQSLDGVPYWLLPLRPAYLKFFQFALQGEGSLRGRPVYIIDFKPAHRSPPKLPDNDAYYGASAWQGTVWIDQEEAQLARVQSRKANPARGLFGHTFFGIEYERVSKDVWFPAGYCNVLGGDVGEKAWAKVSFVNSDFRRMDVQSQIEYVSSTVRYK